jgi:hypothetical protein
MNNQIVEKKLARFVSKLPSDYLEHLSRVDSDARKRFSECRAENKLISKCWLSRILGHNSPIEQAYMDDEISDATHRQIWNRVRFLQGLWSIVQLGERYVRREAKRQGKHYPFSSASGLFKGIVRGWFDSGYAICLEDCSFEISKMRDAVAIANAYIRNDFKAVEESSVLRSLTAPYQHIQAEMNHWFIFAMQTCELAGSNDGALRDELDAFYGQLGNDFSFFESWLKRKRGSREFPKLESTRYIDQQKHQGRMS